MSLTAINGTAAAVVQAIADLDTDPTDFNVTVSNAGTIDQLSSIDSDNGNGSLTYTSVTDTAENLACNIK